MNNREEAALKLEEVIGYQFNDKMLLIEALSHTSYTNERKLNKIKSYQRLEFLGDAVLEMFSSMSLFKAHPDFTEGMLTKARASMVCEEALAECARNIRLGDYILLGIGENRSGGNSKDSILSDVFEALIGAVFIDGGYERAHEFIQKYVIDFGASAQESYKTELQELIQARDHNSEIEYEVVNVSGPEHNRSFTVRVLADGKVLGNGTGGSKKEAENRAAQEAVKSLKGQTD